MALDPLTFAAASKTFVAVASSSRGSPFGGQFFGASRFPLSLTDDTIDSGVPRWGEPASAPIKGAKNNEAPSAFGMTPDNVPADTQGRIASAREAIDAFRRGFNFVPETAGAATGEALFKDLGIQRIIFLVLGILLFTVGAALLAAPRLGFGSFREEWLRSSAITASRQVRKGIKLDTGGGDGAGPGDDSRPGPFDFSPNGPPLEIPARVKQATQNAAKAAPKARSNPFAQARNAKRWEPFKGGEATIPFGDGGRPEPNDAQGKATTRARPLKGDPPKKPH